MIKKSIHNLNKLLTEQEKKKIVLLVVWSIFVSIIEMVTLILILPFLAIVLDHSIITSNEYVSSIYKYLNFESNQSFINFLAFLLIFLYLIRAGFNTGHLYEITKFSNSVVANIRTRLFDKDIRLIYPVFANKNISSLSNNIIVEANNLYHIVFPLLTIVSEGVVFILLIGLLIYTNFIVSMFLFVFFIFISTVIIKFFKNMHVRKGKERTAIVEKNFRLINESFGNFKYLKLSHMENNISEEFLKNNRDLSIVLTWHSVLLVLPKYIFETFGLIIIVIAILYLSSINSVILSSIGIYIVSFYRILPSVNKIINSINNLKYYENSFDKIIENLQYNSESILEKEERIDFQSSITLKNISFSYDRKIIFNNINFTIKKNDKIAFIGESGGGKSTLINILTTLIYDFEGEIYIDDLRLNNANRNSWRKKIGYIPQDIYLFDGSVADNIVFGSEIMDRNKIIEVLKIAKIYDFFMKKDGLDTQVGDNAIQLSGGQKQRLAIARALYREPEVLVLDEATSALDPNTEEEIMQDIYKLSDNKTLIIVAHRLSTITGCSRVIEIKDGVIHERK